MDLGSKNTTQNRVTDDQLRQFNLFKQVDLDPLRPLIERCLYLTFDPNEIILSPMWGNRKMYLLLAGKVTVHLDSPESNVLLELGAGECLGEMSVFDGDNPSAYVKTVTTCEVLVVDRTVLWQMIDTSHALCRNLLSLLSGRLRSGNDILATSKHNELEHQEAANKDSLTGLHNRRWLDKTIDSLQGWELYNRLPMTVLMIDVDHFKNINDTYGHVCGDLVLQMTAQTIKKTLRPRDSVARYGGEEFVVLLTKTSVNHGLKMAERLRRAVSACTITVDQGQALPEVTISLGVALADGTKSVSQVITEADNALYTAKKNGRNRVELNH